MLRFPVQPEEDELCHQTASANQHRLALTLYMSPRSSSKTFPVASEGFVVPLAKICLQKQRQTLHVLFPTYYIFEREAADMNKHH